VTSTLEESELVALGASPDPLVSGVVAGFSGSGEVSGAFSEGTSDLESGCSVD